MGAADEIKETQEVRTTWRLLRFGFVSWLIPFAVSCVIFPLKQAQPSLFDNLMAAVLTSVAVGLGCLYLKRTGADSLVAAVGVGAFWWGCNVGLDLLCFSWGPMKMPVATYLTDIGLAYNIYPIILAGFYVASRSKKQVAGSSA